MFASGKLTGFVNFKSHQGTFVIKSLLIKGVHDVDLTWSTHGLKWCHSTN